MSVQFISPLPARYKEHSRVINKAITENRWTEIGVIAKQTLSSGGSAASYKAYDTKVNLYGNDYRAIVFHSTVLDNRRLKRIARRIEKDKLELINRCKELNGQKFFCRPDASNAAASLKPGKYHNVTTTIIESPIYSRGRPSKTDKRHPISYRYRVETEITQNPEAIEPLKLEAGCFVILANRIPFASEANGMGLEEVLRAYKEQCSIEQSFRFLKDPMILDSLYLKTLKRSSG